MGKLLYEFAEGSSEYTNSQGIWGLGKNVGMTQKAVVISTLYSSHIGYFP